MQATRERVLDGLAEGPVSGPDLAERLDVSRAAVWKHVEALREAGFGIESGDEGYRLVSVPAFGGPAVEYGLDAPFEVEFHDEIASTNARARELAVDGGGTHDSNTDTDDVVVLADRQTGGRGRLDRPWSSPSGGVWLSVLSRPTVPAAHAPAFTLAAAVATTRAAREAGVDARIKWPNDVVVPAPDCTAGVSANEDPAGDFAHEDPVSIPAHEGEPPPERKLAGVLTEMAGEADRISWLVVGVGVNANVDPGDLPSEANPTSLLAEIGDVDRRAFTQRLLEEYDALRRDLDSAVDAWREHAVTLGRRVRVDTPGDEVVGEAVDVRFPGTLVVDTGDGRVDVSAGDCEHLRPVS